jgi:hypothetical protein
VFSLQSPDEVIKWATEVCFFDSPDQEEDSLILGHSGFLDFFSATFDGKSGSLSLDANDELPVAG